LPSRPGTIHFDFPRASSPPHTASGCTLPVPPRLSCGVRAGRTPEHKARGLFHFWALDRDRLWIRASAAGAPHNNKTQRAVALAHTPCRVRHGSLPRRAPYYAFHVSHLRRRLRPLRPDVDAPGAVAHRAPPLNFFTKARRHQGGGHLPITFISTPPGHTFSRAGTILKALVHILDRVPAPLKIRADAPTRRRRWAVRVGLVLLGPNALSIAGPPTAGPPPRNGRAGGCWG